MEKSFIRQKCEEAETDLVLLPGPPSSYADDPSLKAILSNRVTVELLQELKCKGILLQIKSSSVLAKINDNEKESLPTNSETSDMLTTGEPFPKPSIISATMPGQNTGEESDQVPVTGALTVPSLFIPGIGLDKLVLFKHINNVNTNTADIVSEQLSNQLKTLNSICSEMFNSHLPSSETIIPVQKINLFLFLISEKACQDVTNAITTNVSNFENVSNLNIEVASFVKQKSVAADKWIAKNPTFFQFMQQPCGKLAVKQLLNYVIECEFSLKLTNKNFRTFGGQQCQLTNPVQMSEIFSEYFPKWEKKLETIPNYDRVLDNSLYSTGNEGYLKKSGTEGYFGEIKFFWERVLKFTQTCSGVLIKGFDQLKINSLMNAYYNYGMSVEIDWLYCGVDRIVAFEIGVANNFDNPSSSIMNKISQVIKKILPSFQLFLATFFHTVGKISEETREQLSDAFIRNFVKQNLQIVIYLPNVSIENAQVAFSSIQSKLADFSAGKKVSPSFQFLFESMRKPSNPFDQIFFLLPADPNLNMEVPKLFTLDKDFNLLECSTTVNDLLSHKRTTQNAETGAILKYFAALFTYSTLIFKGSLQKVENEAMKLEERYKQSNQEWILKNYKGHTKTFMDIILSPQQYRILDEDKQRVCVIGEPGCGKTSLLLAKLMKSVYDEETETVIFAVAEEKELFYQFLAKFVDENIDESLQSKVKIISYKRETNNFLQISMEFFDNINDFDKTTLLIDEIYDISELDSFYDEDHDLTFCLRRLKSCWLGLIDAGKLMQPPSQFSICANFEVEPLNVLFRNSHHICELSSNILHRVKPLSQTTARVPGCLVSSQQEVSMKVFSSMEDLVLTDDTYLNDKFVHDRMVIVLSHDKHFGWWSTMQKRKDVKMNGENLFVPLDPNDISGLSFTGGEAWSVLVIIDESFDFFDITSGSFDMAITRAQYEAVVLVHETHETLIRHMLFAAPPPHMRVFSNPFMDANYEFKKLEKEPKFTEYVNLIISAVHTCDSKMLRMVTEKSSSDAKVQVAMRALQQCLFTTSNDALLAEISNCLGTEIRKAAEKALYSLRSDQILLNVLLKVVDLSTQIDYFLDAYSQESDYIEQKEEFFTAMKLQIKEAFYKSCGDRQHIVGVINDNITLLEQLMENKFPDEIAGLKAGLLDYELVQFGRRLKRGEQFEKENSDMIGFLRRSLTAGNIQLVDAFLKIIGEKLTRKLVTRWRDFLYYACLNGSLEVISWALEIVKTYGDVSKQVNMLYDQYNPLEGAQFDENNVQMDLGESDDPVPNTYRSVEDTVIDDDDIDEGLFGISRISTTSCQTLLTLLCSRNSDLEGVRLIAQKNLDHNTLLHKFMERNCLHWAIDYQNVYLVELLFSDPVRKELLLNSFFERTEQPKYRKKQTSLTSNSSQNLNGVNDNDNFEMSSEGGHEHRSSESQSSQNFVHCENDAMSSYEMVQDNDDNVPGNSVVDDQKAEMGVLEYADKFGSQQIINLLITQLNH